MGDKKITNVVDTGDGSSGEVIITTKDIDTGKEYTGAHAYGGSSGYSKAEAEEKAAQDSINKH
jgi:hypothetical protein